MRYRLRTLLIILAVGPPVLAGAWLSVVWISRHPAESVLLVFLLSAFLIAATIAANLKRMLRAIDALSRWR